MRINRAHILYIVFVILFVSSIVLAIDAVWIEGTITRDPEIINSNHYVQVDGNLFRIMPDISIVQRYYREPEASDDKAASIDSISRDKKILMKVKYQDIYQIIIL